MTAMTRDLITSEKIMTVIVIATILIQTVLEIIIGFQALLSTIGMIPIMQVQEVLAIRFMILILMVFMEMGFTETDFTHHTGLEGSTGLIDSIDSGPDLAYLLDGVDLLMDLALIIFMILSLTTFTIHSGVLQDFTPQAFTVTVGFMEETG